MSYIPPVNFGYVEDNVFRSGEPKEKNFSFIETLKLKTVIVLSPEGPNPALRKFLEEHVIECQHLTAESSQSEMVTEGVIVQALRVILDPTHYPVLVCCGVGRHRTGTLIGCLRKLQNWNLTSILAEYRRFAGNKQRLENEQFIELFDTELVSMSPTSAHGGGGT
eukprot:NODE_8988_length_629_cov_35.065217_g8360_i0.p1 GENE.NODE_8988_length_629_cov_35.065217_g8360_i0~~NODE_8988_length_629_cov_35.065217_g8360_i0.p1  ORF type:complete len:165 (-),score=14.48 NODE_8988_length_629_cov_35.065217_g8360_i0:65-559(-)